jgi:hypothetical protein
MVSDVLLPKLLGGYPVTFVRAEGLNDFLVRVNSEKEQIISRELWRSLMDYGSPISASGGQEDRKSEARRAEHGDEDLLL